MRSFTLRAFVPFLVIASSCAAGCTAKVSSSGQSNSGTEPGGAGKGAASDGGNGADGSGNGDDGGAVSSGPPAVQFVGRFDDGDPVGPRFAWPGAQIVARFEGTSVTVRLSQTFAGFQGGPTWFNVIVDGNVVAPFSVTGLTEDHELATGLAAGTHTVVLEKRTEPNHGTVRFEGFAFPDGKLLAPPAARSRRIEFIGESTIDGFGVEGDRNTTCAGGAPAQFDNVRKSVAAYSASALDAELHVTAYSGKGIARNTTPEDTATMPAVFGRALPDPGTGTTWNTASWVPDVVVISLGGVDFDGGVSTAPADFQSAYAAFVASIRTSYGPTSRIVLTVWSQLKDGGGDLNVRSAVSNAIDGVVASRAAAGDDKVTKYVFPEANANFDETGCYAHANAAHHQAMANLLVPYLKTLTGW